VGDVVRIEGAPALSRLTRWEVIEGDKKKVVWRNERRIRNGRSKQGRGSIMIQMQTNLDVADIPARVGSCASRCSVAPRSATPPSATLIVVRSGGHSARRGEEGRGDEAVVVRIRKDIKPPMARSSASTATRPC